MVKHRIILALLITVAASLACEFPNMSPMDEAATETAAEQTYAAALETRYAKITETAQAAATATAQAAFTKTATATDTKAPEAVTPTLTVSPVPTDTAAPPSLPKFTNPDAPGLLVQAPDAPEYKFSKLLTFGPDEKQGLKEWFGSAPDAQPFIDDGLGFIVMAGSISGPSPCTKECFFVSSVMLYISTTDAQQAVPLLLDYELRLNKTNQQLTPDEIAPVINGSALSPIKELVGVRGTSGTGKYAETVFSLFAADSNAVLVLQGGGVPNAITPGDVFPFFKAMVDHAAGGK